MRNKKSKRNYNIRLIGNLLSKEDNAVEKKALIWNLGSRLRKPKNSWKRTVMKEIAKERKIWSKAKDTFKYHVFAPMGRFQLELIYLYFPPSFYLTVVVSVL